VCSHMTRAWHLYQTDENRKFSRNEGDVFDPGMSTTGEVLACEC
jgi:hypothetical protein